jgi:hypothetical protein
MVEMPRLSPGLEMRDVGDEVLVYDHRNDKVHVFNRTAGHVLRLCDGARSTQEIANALRAAYSGVSQTVDDDVSLLLTRLAQEQLLAE